MHAARLEYLTGKAENGRTWLEKAENWLVAQSTTGNPGCTGDDLSREHLRGMMETNWANLYVFEGAPERAVYVAELALSRLPESDALWRARALHSLGLAYIEMGELEQARQILEQAVFLALQTGNAFFVFGTTGEVVDILLWHGALRRAEQFLRQALDAFPGQASYAAGLMWFSQGVIYFERNQLDEAEKILREAIELSERGGIGLDEIGARVQAMMIWILLARGSRQAALDIFARMNPVRDLTNRMGRELAAAWAHLALDLGDLAQATDWARAYEQVDPIPSASGTCGIVLAKVYLAEDQLEKAQMLLEHQLADAESQDLKRAMIEIHILLALVYARQNRPQPARAQLLSAVELAAPEGFVRVFAAEGDALLGLLKLLRRDVGTGPLAQFIEQLLAALPDSAAEIKDTSPNQTLVEPLTERELEVLGYLAKGMSLPEIARVLVLSPNTLKAHTNSIYAKLGVHSKLQAVNLARELGLL
jgi:LuxR family transcriptional regulator, maltose regulon positive regulatory protein